MDVQALVQDYVLADVIQIVLVVQVLAQALVLVAQVVLVAQALVVVVQGDAKVPDAIRAHGQIHLVMHGEVKNVR